MAALKPAAILMLVTASVSLAAATFFPSLVLGLFWRGATRQGAVAGMLVGLAVVIYYMLAHSDGLLSGVGRSPTSNLWFGIQPMSAGVFGVPAGLLVAWLVSLLGKRSA